MIKKFQRVIAFDLDGTLIDSAPDITNALNYVLLNNNLKKVELKDVKRLIGSGAKALIRDSFTKQGVKITNISSLSNSFLKKYNKCFKNKTTLFPYADKILKELVKNKFKIVLVSNKPEYYCKELLKHFNISAYFSFIAGGDTFAFRKPDPRHVTETLKMARISNYSCLFIGDSKFDLKCSDNANIPCILLSHGYSNINIKNLNAYKVANNLKEAMLLIKKYFSKY